VYGTNADYDPSLFDKVRRLNIGKLCIHPNGMPAKLREFVVLKHFGPDHNLGVFNNNLNNTCKALLERYFFCGSGSSFRPALSPQPNIFTSLVLKDFHDKVMSFMPDLPRLSRRQVVDRYTGRKRAIYEQALLSLQRKCLTEEDALLSTFTKLGKDDTSKAPRVINPRSTRYNLQLGTYIKHAEKPFFKAINRAFCSVTKHTVIKGLNSSDSAAVIRAKWDSFRNPVAIGLDAKKFDLHVSVDALRYEHKFYTALFPGSRELKWLLKQQLYNTGKAHLPDGRIKFSIRGTRSSGDLNTSLGNCLIMCATIHAFAAKRCIRVELCNNGDDCVVIMESHDLGKFTFGLDRWFEKLGFEIVAEKPVYHFEEIEFCQTHPVLLHDGWRMVRNHSAVLTRSYLSHADSTLQGVPILVACCRHCWRYVKRWLSRTVRLLPRASAQRC